MSVDYAIVVDGNALIYRIYYATQGRKTEDQAFAEFFKTISVLKIMIRKMLSQYEDYKYAVVVFDTSRKTFRREKFEEYKANRKSMPTPLFAYLNSLKKTFVNEGFNLVDAPDLYEGDDAIATLSNIFSEFNVKTHVFSTDRDLLQLVNENVSVFLFRPGKIEKHSIDNFEALNDGLMPCQIPHQKALSGDTSDNYKGLAGVGDVTAKNWLKKYGNVENIYENLDELRPSHRKILLDNREKLNLFLELAYLVKDLNLSKDLNLYIRHEIDSGAG